jgi:NADPH:quinone reductase
MIRVTRSAVIDAPIDAVWAVLRDFNSHIDWHPAIKLSRIEGRDASDQVGCVRAFTLQDGSQLREQLLALSDEDCVSTYCILDSTIPLMRYVATLRLKPVTDGNRTFWHWQSTFSTPLGQEKSLSDAVGNGVYDAGFAAMKQFIKSAAAQKYFSSRPGASVQRETSFATGRSAIELRDIACDAIVVQKHGGAETLIFEKRKATSPLDGEVRIRQRAIGVNYIDVYVRTGAYPMLTPPGVPGMEAAGEVIDVGRGVAHLMPGDRVAYACPPVGAYASVRTMSAEQVVRIPDAIDFENAAALMLKGMTAEYLLHRTHCVKAGDTILVHAAAGGVGLLVCQWARHLGVKVIGTVSNAEKAKTARDAGCEFPIITNGGYAFADEVLRITDGRGVDVVYDGLGQPAFAESIKSLAMCGHLVSYGQSAGALEPISSSTLSSKSITLSRPVLFHYTCDRATLNEIAANVFSMVECGVLNVRINHRYPLADAAQAHRDLEARKTSGAIVLLS